MLLGEGGEAVGELLVVGEGIAGEARIGAAEIIRRQGVRRLDLAGEEGTAQRAIGDEGDAELAAGGEELALRPAGPERILALQRRDGMHLMSAAKRFRRDL